MKGPPSLLLASDPPGFHKVELPRTCRRGETSAASASERFFLASVAFSNCAFLHIPSLKENCLVSLGIVVSRRAR